MAALGDGGAAVEGGEPLGGDGQSVLARRDGGEHGAVRIGLAADSSAAHGVREDELRMLDRLVDGVEHPAAEHARVRGQRQSAKGAATASCTGLGPVTKPTPEHFCRTPRITPTLRSHARSDAIVGAATR